MSLALALAPSGRLFVEDSDEASLIPGSEAAERIRRAFGEGNSSGLLHLATVELGTDLPPSLWPRPLVPKWTRWSGRRPP
jgi:hypothetical protein